MDYPKWMLDAIRCPETKEPLQIKEDHLLRADGLEYPIIDGIPSLVFPPELVGQDKKLNRFYDLFAPLYDLSERFFGRLITGIDIREGRKEIVSHLGLRSGMTVLEVSPGPGVFQQHIWDKITPNGELVALDLSLGMLRQCRKKQGRLGTHLIQGNGAYLPFMDGSFDALFHFGGLNLFNEPEKALSEFVRVVRDGGIVSWGDEGFAPSVPEGWKKRLLTRVNPGFLKPIPTVPDGTTDVAEYEVYGGFAYLEVAIKG